MEASGGSPVLRRDGEMQVDDQLHSADALWQETEPSRAAELDSAQSSTSAFNVQSAETNVQTVSMGRMEHRSTTPGSPTAGRGRAQSWSHAAPSLEVNGYHGSSAQAMATGTARTHVQAEATGTLCVPQTPGQSAGTAAGRPGSGQRRRIGETHCSAFNESIEGEIQVKARPPPPAGKPQSLMVRRTSLQALVAKKWTPPGSATRRESTTSTGSGSGVNFSKRSIQRGSTDEAERAVKAIVKRVSRRQEAAEKRRGSSGRESGDDGIDSNESDDNVHQSDAKAEDADSDCDVSCDRVLDTARERLADRRKDVDSALAWLKHELHQIRAQDEQLLQQFHKLRHGIFLLRQQSGSRHFHRTLSRRKRNPKSSSVSTTPTIGSVVLEEPPRDTAAWDTTDFGCADSNTFASTASELSSHGRPMPKSFLGSMFRMRSNSTSSHSSMWHIEEVSSLPSSPVCRRVQLASTLSGSSPCIENVGDSSEEDDEPLAGHLPRVPSVRVKKARRMSSAVSSGSEGDIGVRQRSMSIGEHTSSSRRQSQAPAPQPAMTYKALKRQAAWRYEKRQSRRVEGSRNDQLLAKSASDDQLKSSEIEPLAPAKDNNVTGNARNLNLLSPNSPSVLEIRVLDSPIMQTSPRVVRVCKGEVLLRTPVRVRKMAKSEHHPGNRQRQATASNADGKTEDGAREVDSQSSERQRSSDSNLFQFPDSAPQPSDSGIPLTQNLPPELESDKVEPSSGVDTQLSGLPQRGHPAELPTESTPPGAQEPAKPAKPDIFYPTVGIPPHVVVPQEKYGTLPRNFRSSKRLSITEKADRKSRDDSELALGTEIYNMIHSSSIASGQMLNRRYSQLSDEIDFNDAASPPPTPSKRSSFILRRRSSRQKNLEATTEDVVPELITENSKAIQLLGLNAHHRRESMQFFDRETLKRDEDKPPAAEKKSNKISRWRKDDAGTLQRALDKRRPSELPVGDAVAGSPSLTSPVLLSYSPSLDAAWRPTVAAPVWAADVQATEWTPSRQPLDDDRLSGNPESPSVDGRHGQARLRKMSSTSVVTEPAQNQNSFRARKRRITVSAGAIPTAQDRQRLANKPVTPRTGLGEQVGEDVQTRDRANHVSSKSVPGLKHAMDKIRKSLPGGVRRRASTADKPVKLRRGKVGKVDTEYETVRSSPLGTPVEGRSANPTPLGSMADLGDAGSGSASTWLTASHGSPSNTDGLQPLTSAHFLGGTIFDTGRPRSFTTNDFYLSRSMTGIHDEEHCNSHNDVTSPQSGDVRLTSGSNSLANLREDPDEQVHVAAATTRQRTHL